MNVDIDIEYVKRILDCMQYEIEKLTTGNVSHKRPSLLMGINSLKEILCSE